MPSWVKVEALKRSFVSVHSGRVLRYAIASRGKPMRWVSALAAAQSEGLHADTYLGDGRERACLPDRVEPGNGHRLARCACESTLSLARDHDA